MLIRYRSHRFRHLKLSFTDWCYIRPLANAGGRHDYGWLRAWLACRPDNDVLRRRDRDRHCRHFPAARVIQTDIGNIAVNSDTSAVIASTAACNR